MNEKLTGTLSPEQRIKLQQQFHTTDAELDQAIETVGINPDDLSKYFWEKKMSQTIIDLSNNKRKVYPE